MFLEEKRAWYQMYAHALCSFLRSALMPNDVFTEDNLLGRRDGRNNSSTTNRDLYRKPPICGSLTFCYPHTQNKYSEDYGLHESV